MLFTCQHDLENTHEQQGLTPLQLSRRADRIVSEVLIKEIFERIDLLNGSSQCNRLFAIHFRLLFRFDLDDPIDQELVKRPVGTQCKLDLMKLQRVPEPLSLNLNFEQVDESDDSQLLSHDETADLEI
jgi:hypothetical protein